MEISNLKVKLLPHTPFLDEKGKFDLKKAMNYQGQIGGICYNEDGLEASFKEPLERTEKRVDRTTFSEHQTVFEHINIGFHLQNSPKFLLMMLNNEHQYTTSERSLRYTAMKEDASITEEMFALYDKWNEIFFTKIKKRYGHCKSDSQIRKLAQENSRYLLPVTMSTEMVHTIPLAQLNRVMGYILDYIENGVNGEKDNLHEQMVPHLNKFYEELSSAGVLDERLLSTNRKHRSLSIFGTNLSETKINFGDTYSTTYWASFVYLAQNQRHRTQYCQMEREKRKNYTLYFTPPIIEDDLFLSWEWEADMYHLVEKYNSVLQGEMVRISEKGTLDNFILKMKERLCSSAQLEIAMQTKETRDRYYNALLEKNSPLAAKLEPYMRGARCTFPDYDCPKDCGFKEGKTLVRKI